MKNFHAYTAVKDSQKGKLHARRTGKQTAQCWENVKWRTQAGGGSVISIISGQFCCFHQDETCQDQCRPSQARLPARQSGSQNAQVRKFSDMDPNISRPKKVSSLVNYFTCPFGHVICRLGRVEGKADTKHPTLWIQGKALLIGSHGFGELAEFGRLVRTTFQVSYDVEYVKIRKGKCIKTKNSSPSPQPWGYRASEAIAWSCPRRAHACRWAAA